VTITCGVGIMGVFKKAVIKMGIFFNLLQAYDRRYNVINNDVLAAEKIRAR